MNKSNISRPMQVTAVFAFLALVLAMGCRKATSEEKSAATSAPSQLAKDMIGAWVHLARPRKVMEVPAEAGPRKCRTGKHWTLTYADPTGLVTEHFGGTYTLNGDVYVETQDYGDERWMKDNGKSFKFKVTVEGDT